MVSYYGNLHEACLIFILLGICRDAQVVAIRNGTSWRVAAKAKASTKMQGAVCESLVGRRGAKAAAASGYGYVGH